MHAPITRYEVQPAGSDRAEKQLGRRGTVPERKTVGSLSKEDAARPQYLGLRHAVPSARSSAQQSLEVRRQQRRTTRLFPGVKIASASAVALNPLFATRPRAECGPVVGDEGASPIWLEKPLRSHIPLSAKLDSRPCMYRYNDLCPSG